MESLLLSLVEGRGFDVERSTFEGRGVTSRGSEAEEEDGDLTVIEKGGAFRRR